jgi:SulP family sulfate permease
MHRGGLKAAHNGIIRRVPPAVAKLFPFLAWRRRVTAANLRADLIAGAVGALVVLPQGVAYATLAGLPPQYGLYAAIVPAIVAALFGSSWHQVSGPTNAMALVVYATLATLAAPGSPRYVELALTLAFLIGIVQLALGLARLGTLVNFIAHTVIVGFTAGAGILIIASQLRNFTGVAAPADASFFRMVGDFVGNLSTLEPWVLATGIVTLVTAIAAKHAGSRAPYMIVAMVVGSTFAYVVGRAGFATVPSVGALPAQLPPLSLPSFDPHVWRQLAPTALALTVLGLTQAISIARAVAVKAGQRIDGNQEFIGQGLSNIAGAFTSSMPSSGSINRCGVNFEAGARTPLSAVFAAALLAAILLVVAPLATYLPLAVMAALLFVVAWALIDIAEIRRIARTNRSDLIALVVTFIATLTVQLEFAIFVGVIASLLVYLNRTTHPSLTHVAPDARTPQRRFAPVSAHSRICPQLDILRMDGSLFFGAVEHVRDELEAARGERPHATHVLLVGTGMNFIDIAGCEALVQASRYLRDTGATLYLCNLKPSVQSALDRGGFLDEIGRDRVWPTKADAIRALYKRLDMPVCEACTARIFTECHIALPNGMARMVSATHSG